MDGRMSKSANQQINKNHHPRGFSPADGDLHDAPVALTSCQPIQYTTDAGNRQIG
jgi:hypothetical protein